MRKTLAVASKELRQILRDRRTLLILLFVPAFFLLLYGYALNFDIRNVPPGRPGPGSQHQEPRAGVVVRQLRLLHLVGYVDSPTELDRLVDEGRVRAILSIPSGFERDLSLRQPVTVQVIIDGDNANTASTVMGYARTLIGEYSSAQMQALTAAPGSRLPVPVDHRRAAHLVQPAAAQHAVPGAGPDRLHLDDHRRRLDGAVGRAREGARHDGAGADGAAQPAALHHRQDAAVSRDLVRVGDPGDPRRRCCCSTCRCAARGCCCAPRSACS